MINNRFNVVYHLLCICKFLIKRIMKKNKTRNIDEQLQKLLYEEYGEEYIQWYKKTFDVKLYFDGAETSDSGYLTDREFDEWKEEKWKQFLKKYGY